MGHLGDESLQAVDYTGTESDDRKQRNKIAHAPDETRKTQETCPCQDKHKTTKHGFYDIRPEN